MRLPRWTLISVAACAALLLCLALTIRFIPNREIEALCSRFLAQQGYSLSAGSFGKSFPLGITATALEIADVRGVLLKAERVTLRLRLLPLLAGRAEFTGKAVIAEGQVSAAFSARQSALTLGVSGLRLEELPFIETVTGAKAKGVASLDGHFRRKAGNGDGQWQLEIQGANFSGIRIGELPLPDADYAAIRGMLKISGNLVTLESFTFTGEGLYVRLKGNFPLASPLGGAPLNLTLEMMPKPEFLEKQKFVFLLLSKYLDTPGHYEIPIKGVLAKPLIQ